jgi:hypothetical protein
MSDVHAEFSVSWDDAACLARIDWSPGAVCGIAEARAVDRAIEALGHGPVRCLVDLAGVDTIDRAAREHFIQSPQYAAVALVAQSTANRVLANFFLRLKREQTPARIFTDETEAVAWLRGDS